MEDTGVVITAATADKAIPENLRFFAFDFYQEIISTFDVSGLESYGKGSTPLWYYMLGLAGETAEFADKVYSGRAIAMDLGRELGDILWYACRAIDKLGFKVSEITKEPMMGPYYESHRPYDEPLRSYTLGLSGTIKLVDTVKKLYRNSQSDKVPAERALEIATELGKVIYFVASCGAALNIPLAEIAAMNIRKLADRTRRNVVRSEGDNR